MDDCTSLDRGQVYTVGGAGDCIFGTKVRCRSFKPYRPRVEAVWKLESSA